MVCLITSHLEIVQILPLQAYSFENIFRKLPWELLHTLPLSIVGSLYNYLNTHEEEGKLSGF
jgi:hypothetical protein